MSGRLKYCIVRYTPDRGVGERINIGIAILNPATMSVDVVLDERGTALTAVFDGFSQHAYKKWVKEFKSSLRQTGLKWMNRLPFDEDRTPTFSSLLGEAQSSWGDSIDVSEERVILAYDTDSTVLRDLYERYVGGQRTEAARYTPHFTESRIWDRFQGALRAHRLASLITTMNVDVMGMKPFAFEHTIKVEKFRALQPVSFDLADDVAIKNRVARWAGLSTRFVPNDDLEGIYYLVAPPAKEDLMGEYRAAIEWLSATNLARQIVEVSTANDFAARTESEIREKGIALVL